MTLALRRFRLDGIGPAGARFDPLAVDLGADGKAARTAVLFLENGGGKSVLLRLLFSVVLPGRRYTVGSVKLDGYVGSGDTSHVALEWDTSQRPLVTGTLLEWRNRTRSGSTSNLLQFWYSFVPRAGVLTLDDLPTREDGRRLTRSGFRERLTGLARDHPELELVIEDAPGKWVEHLLRSTPLDPEIFRYQRQMNADEADAESLFAGIRTDEDFVRFVVEAVHDPEQLDGFDELLSEYAVHLGRHDELVLEGRFCAAAADALRPLGAAAETLGETRREAATSQQTSDRLRAELLAGAHVADEDARRWRDEAADCSRRSEAVTAEAKRIADIASELRRLEAVFLHAHAEQEEQAARVAADEARRTAIAWEAVGDVVALRRSEAALRRLRHAQEHNERDLAPLRQGMEDAASSYVGRLLAEADSLDREAVAAAEAAHGAAARAEDLSKQSAAAERRAGAELATAEGRRERIAEVAEAVARLRSEGVLAETEAPGDGVSRATTERDDAWRLLAETRARKAACDLEQRELLEGSGSVRAELVELRGRFDGVRRELDDRQAAADALVAEPRVLAIAPDASDIWTVAGRVEQVLDASVAAAESSERTLRERIDEADARLDRLDVDGLLPAAADVVTVWDTIVAAGIPATTGWSWLAHNRDDEGRAQVLATNPALAGGVIVSDPGRLLDAEAAVRGAAVETETVVLIGTAEQLDEPGAGVAAPVRPALYDPSWTERTRQAIEQERAELITQQAEALEVLSIDAPLLSRLRGLVQRCPAHRREMLNDEAERLDGEIRIRKERIEGLDLRAKQVSSELAALADGEPQLAERAATLEAVHGRLAMLAEQQQAAERWEQEALAAEARSDRESKEAERLAAEAGEARDGAEADRRRAERGGSEAAGRRDIALRVGVEPAELAPDEPTEALAGAYDAARRTYEAERDGRDLTPEIERVEGDRERRAEQLSALDSSTRDEARRLADAPGAEDPSVRRDRISEAWRSTERLAETHGARQKALGAAEQVLADRKPRTGRQRFTVLDADIEPQDAEQAARSAEQHQAMFAERTQEARDAQRAASGAREQQNNAEARAALLRSTVDILPGPVADPIGAEPAEATPWDRSIEEAQTAARAARRRFDDMSGSVQVHERAFNHALTEVRRVAHDPALAKVGGVRLALANEAADDLAGRSLHLADELTAMRQSIDHELAETGRHRDGIVQRLATLVESHLRQLKQLARLSTLPPGLGDWSGKPFVAVDFDQVAGAEITARLGPIVDEAAADVRKRNGIDLLLAGMRAAVVHQRGEVERTYTVRLLRPNRMLAFQRASIEELEREFSGGMKLTAAICTYCALAALRANSRSTGSLFGLDPGPLFLDNPLGKASADYLLDIQHALAEKLRVQLVHTTGVWDVEALATYERVVRLRNLADLRHNVRRLRVDDDVRLPGSGATIDAVAFTVGGNGS